jgi:hypothetical protein
MLFIFSLNKEGQFFYSIGVVNSVTTYQPTFVNVLSPPEAPQLAIFAQFSRNNTLLPDYE